MKLLNDNVKKSNVTQEKWKNARTRSESCNLQKIPMHSINHR